MATIQITKHPAQSLPESGTPAEIKSAIMQNLAVYGIWDTVDKCWMGNDSGPLLYREEWMCCAAATITGWRFKQAYRFRKKLFWEDNLQVKDVVTPPLSAVEAMEQNKA